MGARAEAFDKKALKKMQVAGIPFSPII